MSLKHVLIYSLVEYTLSHMLNIILICPNYHFLKMRKLRLQSQKEDRNIGYSVFSRFPFQYGRADWMKNLWFYKAGYPLNQGKMD